MLIALHGGPESQFRPGFDPWIQYMVNELGFAVVAPNVRGSSGYGKTYLALDNGMLREDAVKDVGALLVWIELQKHFDAKHVVVAGGSYGGYLSAGDAGQLQRPLARRRRCQRHRRLRELLDQYRALPAKPAARGIRRRARPRNAQPSCGASRR